jgi:hypothetical protein
MTLALLHGTILPLRANIKPLDIFQRHDQQLTGSAATPHRSTLRLSCFSA